MRCLGEVVDLVGGSEKRFLICELNFFELKIYRSELVREGLFCYVSFVVVFERVIIF